MITIKRLKSTAGVLAGVSALALGGSAIASASTTQTAAKGAAVERVPAVDGDHIKSGNQTTPDVRDRVDLGSRNELKGDRDRGHRAEHTTKDVHGDR